MSREFTKLLDRYRLSRTIEDSTLVNYSAAVSSFEKWLSSVDLSEIHPDDVDTDVLNNFLFDYSRTKIGKRFPSPYSVKTKRKVMIALLNFHLERQHKTIESKFVRCPSCPETVKDSWSPSEVKLLIGSANAIDGLEFLGGRLPRTKRSDYLTCLLAFIWETGARRGDAARVKLESIRNSPAFNFVQNKSRRSVTFRLTEGTRSRILGMPHAIAGRERAFPTWGESGISLKPLTDLANKAMDVANLTSSDGPLKKLRRSSITDVERNSPGTAWLHAGHSEPTITTTHYIDKSRAYESLPGPTPIWAL